MHLVATTLLMALGACGGSGERPTDASSGLVEVVPAPAATDKVLLDLRQSLQQATTITQAFALFGHEDNTPVRGARNTGGWSFTTNFDGNGTHALRADWPASTVDQSIVIAHYLPTPLPSELYVQWKNRLGRHPADPDGNGDVNVYEMYPQSQACKRALFHHANFQNRIDYTLSRSVPEAVKLEMGDFNYGRFGDTTRWNPNRVVGRASFTTTVHLRAASSSTVADGVFQLWINGALLIDQHDVPATADPIYAWSFPTTCVQVPVPQSEYFWDILVWTP
jgi:hypothetical protein